MSFNLSVKLKTHLKFIDIWVQTDLCFRAWDNAVLVCSLFSNGCLPFPSPYSSRHFSELSSELKIFWMEHSKGFTVYSNASKKKKCKGHWSGRTEDAMTLSPLKRNPQVHCNVCMLHRRVHLILHSVVPRQAFDATLSKQQRFLIALEQQLAFPEGGAGQRCFG